MSASASRPDPVSPFVQRLVAASGILFAVLLVVSFALVVQDPPTNDDPISDWTEFADDNAERMRYGALFFGLATYAFALFLGSLRSALGRAEEVVRGFTRGAHIVLAGGILGIAGLSLFVYVGALSIQYPDTPPETLRALNALSGSGLGLGAGGFGACLVTAGLMNAVTRVLPSWLGWVALAGGIAFVLQLGVTLSEQGDENLFGWFFPIALVLLAVFAVGASLTFLREQAGGGAAPRPPA